MGTPIENIIRLFLQIFVKHCISIENISVYIRRYYLMLDSIFTVWTRQTWEATENKDTTGELYNSQAIIRSLGWSFYHTGQETDFEKKYSDETVFPASNMLKC